MLELNQISFLSVSLYWVQATPRGQHSNRSTPRGHQQGPSRGLSKTLSASFGHGSSVAPSAPPLQEVPQRNDYTVTARSCGIEDGGNPESSGSRRQTPRGAPQTPRFDPDVMADALRGSIALHKSRPNTPRAGTPRPGTPRSDTPRSESSILEASSLGRIFS